MNEDINTELMEGFYTEAQTYGLSDSRSQLYANWRMVRDGHGSISKFLKSESPNRSMYALLAYSAIRL